MSPDLIEKGLLLVLGGLVTGIGVLIKRRLGRSRDKEVLERRHRVLEINREMKEQNVTVEDLDKLERVLTRKKRLLEPDAAARSVIGPILETLGGVPTQAQINQMAAEAARAASRELDQTLRTLAEKLEPDRARELARAQAAWEVYKDSQARFAASGSEGGSIWPTLLNVELETLTQERNAALYKAYVEEFGDEKYGA